jgi:hypothetical protein
MSEEKENPFGEATDETKEEEGTTPDKDEVTPDKVDEKRKSLVGLSP